MSGRFQDLHGAIETLRHRPRFDGEASSKTYMGRLKRSIRWRSPALQNEFQDLHGAIETYKVQSIIRNRVRFQDLHGAIET